MHPTGQNDVSVAGEPVSWAPAVHEDALLQRFAEVLPAVAPSIRSGCVRRGRGKLS